MEEVYKDENGVLLPRDGAPRKERLKKIFIKTLAITLISVTVLAVSAYVTYRILIKPPAIPALADASEITVSEPELVPEDLSAEESITDPTAPAPAYDLPIAEPDDIDVGGGLQAPLGFTSADRKEQFYTFLLFGIDGGVNTDTIIVGGYDADNKEANLISIQRDTMVDVQRGLKKINAAYGAGMSNGGGRDGGVSQLKREIKTMIGFEPDFYASVNFKAFTEVVDAIDGIDINVPYRMIYEDPYQGLYINIKKGEQHLNGAEALKFARYRQGVNGGISDFQRIENQQSVINAVMGKLIRPVNLLKIPEFIEIFQEHVRSDMSPENLIWFADQLNHIKNTDALSMHMLPIQENGSGYPMYYEYLDRAAVLTMVNETINPYKKDIKASDLDIAGPNKK